jgi:GxxExxY protein
MKYTPISQEEEEIGRNLVACCFKIHKELGPGLLEKIYEVCLAHELSKLGFSVQSVFACSI